MDSPPKDDPAGPFAKAGAVVTSDLAPVIMEYASPLLQQCSDFASREKAISYAILAWNLSLEKPGQQQEERRELLALIDPSEREQIDQLFDFLLQRKQQRFADNRFYIVDYELNQVGSGLQIRIDAKYRPRGK